MVTLVLMVVLTLFLRRTPYGVQMRAAAEDFRMAQYLGVRANVVIGLAFAISGILAAAVSMLYVTQSGSLTHQMGVPLALFAFVAVVVGGMGNLTGAVVGGFVLGLIVTMLQADLAAGSARLPRRFRVRGRYPCSADTPRRPAAGPRHHRTGLRGSCTPSYSAIRRRSS